jgi:hypothetical protein
MGYGVLNAGIVESELHNFLAKLEIDFNGARRRGREGVSSLRLNLDFFE